MSPRAIRYDTDEVVDPGDWLVAPSRSDSPTATDRWWVIVSARLVRPRGSIPRRYRWSLLCAPQPAPTPDAPYIPEGFVDAVADGRVHWITFYPRTPGGRRWRQVR